MRCVSHSGQRRRRLHDASPVRCQSTGCTRSPWQTGQTWTCAAVVTSASSGGWPTAHRDGGAAGSAAADAGKVAGRPEDDAAGALEAALRSGWSNTIISTAVPSGKMKSSILKSSIVLSASSIRLPHPRYRPAAGAA